MEPLNAVARFHDGRLDIWSGCQSQTRDQSAAAALCNISPKNVHIHTQLAGGSFGRRASIDSDYVMEAVEISKLLGRPNPIRLQWTIENDMRGGRYRPLSVHKMRGFADNAGIVGWHHRIATQSFVKNTPMAGIIQNGVDRIAVEGAKSLPYQIKNFQCELHISDAAIPTLWWRSVGHSYNAYVTEVFFDILARSKGHDPVALRRSLLTQHPKHLAVLDKAISEAGPKPNRAGSGRGVAVHESFRSIVAEVADVVVGADGKIKVERVTCAVNCGFPVNPDVIRAQMEGGIGYGLSAAMREGVTIVAGRVKESNFHDYRPLRISEMPDVSVHILESDQPPTGVGEPGTPPIAPAVANAVFSITQTPMTTLPFFES
jgi:isoquinoline 1-oxidoreductase beta subunit